MSDFTGETKDGTQGNIEELMRLFPQVVTETKDGNGRLVRSVDFAALRELLGDDATEDDERYDFTWAGKKEALREAARPTRKTLRPCKEESKNWGTTRNLYIEGDNLEALKILENTYHGQVKMIYIDPPYNTGHDFIYHDNFRRSQQDEDLLSGVVDEETDEQFSINPLTNGRYHSDWCSMMYPRLQMAYKMLRDDGVMFLSIDDTEVVNVRKLCDYVFGEVNFVAQVVWKNKFGSGAKTNGFIGVHEYLLVYSRIPQVDIARPLTDEERCMYNKTRDAKFPQRGGYVTQPLAVTTFGDRPTLRYPIVYNGQEIWPKKQWVWERTRMEKAIANNEVVFNLQKDGSYSVRSKKYLIDENGKERKGKPTTIFSEVYTQNGTEEIRDLFQGKVVFDYSKPVDLIKHFLSLTVDGDEKNDGVVLDFFSGAATAAHAVMQLNAEDGGNRRFIMVQLPEVCAEDSEAAKAGYKNICEIGKERIRRAGEKISEELRVKNEEREKNKDLFDSSKSGEDATSTLDVGFRVFKVSDSNMEDVFYSPNDVTQAMLPGMVNNVKEGRTGLDLLISTRLEWGLSIDCPIDEETVDGKTVFSVDGGQMLACFETGITDAFVKKLAMRKPQFAIFRDVDFKDSAAKINAREIFKAVCGKDAPTEVRFL